MPTESSALARILPQISNEKAVLESLRTPADYNSRTQQGIGNPHVR
jgi:hypothetical protein